MYGKVWLPVYTSNLGKQANTSDLASPHLWDVRMVTLVLGLKLCSSCLLSSGSKPFVKGLTKLESQRTGGGKLECTRIPKLSYVLLKNLYVNIS